MADKMYYGYVRPKVPSHPWSLERIPLGRSIISISETTNVASIVKSNKLIPFNFKVVDDLGMTVNRDGSFTLPIGKYLIQFSANYSSKEKLELQLENSKFYGVPSEDSLTFNGSTVIDINKNEYSIDLKNIGKGDVKFSNFNLIISKLEV